MTAYEKIYKLGFGDNFSDATPKTQSMKEKTDKVDCMTINFCPAKDTVKGMRRQFTDQKIFAKDTNNKTVI